MGVQGDKLNGRTSLRKSTRKFEQVSFFLPINSSRPSIQVLSTELWSVSMIGSHGNRSVPLRKLRKPKNEEVGNVLFRGDEMRGIKVFLWELGVGLRIPAWWGHSCWGHRGSWLRQLEQGKYSGWSTTPLHLTNNVLLGETVMMVQGIHYQAFFTIILIIKAIVSNANHTETSKAYHFSFPHPTFPPQ